MQSKTAYDIIVGSYGTTEESTIHWLTFDTGKGMFHEVMDYKGIENPSYLTLNENKTRLYAISEVPEGKIHSFHVDQQNKNIHALNDRKTHGAPCYVTLDEDARYVLSANYGGGSFISHHLMEDGRLGTSSDFIAHNGTDSVQPSHIHTIRQVPGSDYFMATDLGQDKLYVYALSANGRFQLLKTIKLPKDSGPRHISFHPTLNIMYVITEFNSRVFTLTYDYGLCNVKYIQSSPTLPEGFYEDNYGADIHVTSKGEFLFTSNRGHQSLTTYDISTDGTIEPIAYTPTLGKWPRNFIILPDSRYIIVANEHTNNIIGMIIKDNGELEQITEPYTIQKPVCIQAI